MVTSQVAYEERSVGESEDDAVEYDGADDDVGALPAVVLDEPRAERREHERPDAGAAHADAGGQRSAPVEVVADDDDRRQVHQAEAGT